MPKKRRPRAARRGPAANIASKHVDVKVPPALYREVREVVTKGRFVSMSEFAREALREKLARSGSTKKK